jgi:hypothetical protein
VSILDVSTIEADHYNNSLQGSFDAAVARASADF